MSDGAIPKAGHGVDVLISVVVVDNRTLTANQGAKIRAGRLCEGMQEVRNHNLKVVPSAPKRVHGVANHIWESLSLWL